MRAFIAIELGAALRASLDEQRIRVTKLSPAARWLKAESLHLTLSFLGEIADDLMTDVDRTLSRVTGAQAPFTIEIRGSGSFGPIDSPKVIWAALGGDVTPLRSMQKRLADDLLALGIAPDYETFEPHVTLARSRHPRGDVSLAKCADFLRSTTFGELAVREVVLFASNNEADGQNYAALARHPLKGPRGR